MFGIPWSELSLGSVDNVFVCCVDVAVSISVCLLRTDGFVFVIRSFIVTLLLCAVSHCCCCVRASDILVTFRCVGDIQRELCVRNTRASRKLACGVGCPWTCLFHSPRLNDCFQTVICIVINQCPHSTKPSICCLLLSYCVVECACSTVRSCWLCLLCSNMRCVSVVWWCVHDASWQSAAGEASAVATCCSCNCLYFVVVCCCWAFFLLCPARLGRKMLLS